MKNIIKSLLVVVAVAAVASGATRAVFSDTDNIANNTVSTAKVEINAKGEAKNGVMQKPINASGLVPGEFTDWARGIVFNTSNSTNVRVYMYVSDVTGDACGKINLRVTTGHADGNERQYDIYNGSLSGITGQGNRREMTNKIFVAPNYLPKNTSLVMQQQAQLDPLAGDSYQNKGCTWNEVFVAESVIVP